MPKKIPISVKRGWLKDFEEGKSEANIARDSQKALNVVKRGIQKAKLEHDGANARSEIIKEALVNHQKQLLGIVARVLSALEVPPSNLELRREKNGALAPIPLPAALVKYEPSKGLIVELSDENAPQWELLKEHLKRNRLWSALEQWRKALVSHIKSRLDLERKIAMMLESETGLRVLGEIPDDKKTSFVFPATVKLFYGVAINKALGIPDETNPQERIIATADGYVLHGEGGTKLAYYPGRQEECRDKIIKVFNKIPDAPEFGNIPASTDDLRSAIKKAKQPLEDVHLLGLVSGQCRICSQVSW